MVYNDEHPEGFSPDDDTRVDENNGPKKYSSGEVDMVVPEGELFVAGDNREGSHSFDSRSGLGTVPYCRIIGRWHYGFIRLTKCGCSSIILTVVGRTFERREMVNVCMDKQCGGRYRGGSARFWRFRIYTFVIKWQGAELKLFCRF